MVGAGAGAMATGPGYQDNNLDHNQTMKTRISRSTLAALLLHSTFNLQLATLFAQGTAFTYQGRLNDGPAPANGVYDLKFTLFDSPTNGDFNGPLTNSAVAVSNGLFTVLLDFGPDVFTGHPNFFLEIGVRTAGGGEFTTLSPRQPVTPSPYAVHAGSATKLFNGAVTRLNNLSDNVTLAAGANVTITPSGNILTIASPSGGIGPWQLNGTNTFYNGGRVGIGTTTPVYPLHLATAAEPSLLLHDTGPATTQSGYISFWNGNSTLTAYLGYGTAGSPHFSVVNVRPGGNIGFFTENGERVTLVPSGNVGIGTTTPQVRLDVRGSVKMGNSGELFATGGEENLRIIRGVVLANGNIHVGLGFSVLPGSNPGIYNITFTTPFNGAPAVTCSVQGPTIIATWCCLFSDRVTISTRNEAGGLQAGDFSFIAVGPR